MNSNVRKFKPGDYVKIIEHKLFVNDLVGKIGIIIPTLQLEHIKNRYYHIEFYSHNNKHKFVVEILEEYITKSSEDEFNIQDILE